MNEPDRLTIITHRYAGSACDQALIDVAAFYGVNSETFDLDQITLPEILEVLNRQGRPCLAMGAGTFIHLSGDQRLRLKRFVERTSQATFFLHSIQPEVARGADWLGDLLNAQVTLTRADESLEEAYYFTQKRPDWTGALTGTHLGKVRPGQDSYLQSSRGPSAPFPLITPGLPKIGGPMAFGQYRVGEGSVYVLTTPPPDEAYGEEGLTAWLTPERAIRVIPLLIFVRGLFGETCWRQPTTHAAFLWSNARLAHRIDHVDLRDVVEETHRLGLHVCLALPPVEFARFEPVAAKLLREHAEHLSVVAYGNDGATDELASVSAEEEEAAETKEASSVVTVEAEVVSRQMGGASKRAIPQALRRMTEFGRKAKAAWGKVMVAPGGTWHPSHLPDLLEYGYGMLIGETPANEARPTKRGLDDLAPALLSAGTDYGPAYPIVRTLKSGGAEQALVDAFIGKPVLIELKPEWFAPGGEHVGFAVMERLATLENGFTWAPPERISQSLYLMRRTTPRGQAKPIVDVRMIAPDILVEDVDPDEEHVEVWLPLPATQRAEWVTLDPRLAGQWFPTSAGDIKFEPMDERRLRIQFKRPAIDVDQLILNDPGVGVLDRVKNMVRMPTGLFRRH